MTLPSTLIDGEVCENVRSFLNQINRGGLLMPTPFAFGICLKSWHIFNQIKANRQLAGEFLKSENPKALFLATTMILIEEDSQLEELEPQWQCNSGHGSVLGLIRRFFNCVMKNWAKSLSSECRVPVIKRKIVKLSNVSY
ncbi:MAG: hypothetical protein GY820_25170 [Gammaproteobacteria bacterium]|nr:hypothetical protein [Gammaproteobacteria bacterium]